MGFLGNRASDQSFPVRTLKLVYHTYARTIPCTDVRTVRKILTPFRFCSCSEHVQFLHFAGGSMVTPLPFLRGVQRRKIAKITLKTNSNAERRASMPRMSLKRKRELSLFLNERGRVAYNELCRRCVHTCKQAHKVIVVECGRYLSKRAKEVKNESAICDSSNEEI